MGENIWATKMATQSETGTQSSKLPIVTVVARAVTLVTLVASLAIMKSNKKIVKFDANNYLLSYIHVKSYKYALFTIVVGLAYTAVQTPFAVYHAIRRKRLINHYGLLQLDFYGDKVISYVLGTAAGAALGVTTDSKDATDRSKEFASIRSEFDDFYNISFISASLLFIGFLFSVVSSIISSCALSKKS